MRVFARVEPTQKLEIVETYARGRRVRCRDRRRGQRRAGIAYRGYRRCDGQGGTDVARGAADLILADDNFSSIVAGVEEGPGRLRERAARDAFADLDGPGGDRAVHDGAVRGLPLPMFPAQLLWLNLVTNGVQHVALAFERGDPRVLNQPPRPPEQSLFERRMIEQTILSGFYMGIWAFVVFAWSLDQGMRKSARAA